MENELNNEFDINDNSLKSLEEFFSKEISNSLTPQEMIMVSLSLNHVASLLNMYNRHANIAIFDVKAFTAKHPEYANIDFNNLKDLDDDTLESIETALHGEDGHDGEEFNKGDILIKNIIKIMLNTSLKLYTSYTKEYGKQAPEDAEQFFTILQNCLENSSMMLKAFFTRGL